MRFLDPDKLDVAGLGNAFPMTFKGGYPFIRDAGLIGKGTNLLVDVGCTIDGLVYEGSIPGMAELLPQRNWDGGNYTNLVMAAPGHINDLGLCFLALALV